jgi:hypothetical protein
MKGHAKNKEDQDIKKLIQQTAKEFNIDLEDKDGILILTKGKDKLEMFYRRYEYDENDNKLYQGLCSKNGGNREKYYNFRACIVEFFGVGVDVVG